MSNTQTNKTNQPKTLYSKITSPSGNGAARKAEKPVAFTPVAKPTITKNTVAAVRATAVNKDKPQPKNLNKPNTNNRNKSKGKNNAAQTKRSPLKFIPLGGLDEIGKNCYVYEYENEIIVVDCGLAFPDDDMPGVDIVICDLSYLVKNQDRIKGLFVTHGHEDHIGGIVYLMNQIKVPVYATSLTLGLIEGKLKEHRINKVKLKEQKPGDTVKVGKFSVEFIHVNHSIPDAVCFAISTPVGTVIHTGDFKIDSTPIEAGIIDLARLSELGNKGVLALLSDSTNAERPGFTMSERTVGNSFEQLFRKAVRNRIIVATFSSNIHRIQQIVDESVKCKRKVAVFGRSMLNVVAVATRLGYLKIPEGVLIEGEQIKNYPNEKLVIITTGSQGEPMSALDRMAKGEHRNVSINPNDTIIISASPIPGNEKTVSNVVNSLMKLGANVIYEKMYDVHVSGHACQEELKIMLAITKPKFFIPVHGEQKQMKRHNEIAQAVGIDKKNIIITTNGKVVELTQNSIKETGMVPSGRVLVDGYGVGDVGSIVLRDRKHLSDDGIIIVVMSMDSTTGEILSGPEIVTRGFIYVRESDALLREAKHVIHNSIGNFTGQNTKDHLALKGKIRDELSKHLYEKTKRSPMILPIIMDV